MKHQVALNAYELDVFSIAGSGGALPPQPKIGGGSAPQPKLEVKLIFFEKFEKKIRKKSISPLIFWVFNRKSRRLSLSSLWHLPSLGCLKPLVHLSS